MILFIVGFIVYTILSFGVLGGLATEANEKNVPTGDLDIRTFFTIMLLWPFIGCVYLGRRLCAETIKEMEKAKSDKTLPE